VPQNEFRASYWAQWAHKLVGHTALKSYLPWALSITAQMDRNEVYLKFHNGFPERECAPGDFASNFPCSAERGEGGGDDHGSDSSKIDRRMTTLLSGELLRLLQFREHAVRYCRYWHGLLFVMSMVGRHT
jgi:hypothetical protein